MTLPPKPTHRRRAGEWFVVRDASGGARHTGRTKAAAIAPYRGAVTKSVVYSNGLDAAPLRKSRLWQFLYRRGWRCLREVKPVTKAGPAPSSRSTTRPTTIPSP